MRVLVALPVVFNIMDKEKDFKEYLFSKYEVKENKKREECFDLAWRFGHSCGIEEVENYFMELVELIK